MQTTPEQFLTVLAGETFKYRNFTVGIFIFINVCAVVIGFVWPKSYTSSATVFVEDKNIIQPLMQGAAVATNVVDRAKIAKEVIFGRKIMNQVLEEAGWLQGNPTDIEKEKLFDALRSRTTVMSAGQNLIRIEYKDSNPERAYKTAQKFTELFISSSLGTQSDESHSAFEFIDSQVKEYHAKLTEAEQGLKEFRTKNVDARPGTEAEVALRINALEATIEKTALELKETQIKQSSLEKQLSGEVVITASLTREGQYLTRVAELQSQLENLRLTYHDTYPDIVRIKHQIEDLKDVVASEQKRREESSKTAKDNGTSYVDDSESIRVNPLYQQLKRELFDTKTKIETLTTRLTETKLTLRTELERAKRIHGGEAAMAELTRDYEVNRDIYQDLLKRRENARVSKNLNRDKQGLTIRVQDPAVLPLQPTGIRFIHFVLGGLFLGFIAPPALIYGLQMADPRIRFSSLITDKLNLPVLAEVPHLVTPSEVAAISRGFKLHLILIFLTLGFVTTISLFKLFRVV
jgi:polysaccharide chain length determinant protein (PEP-CTERM system associated)